MAKLVALILAKKDSKRLPNKNTLPFHGKPMFLENVTKCLSVFDEVYVSSDDDEILAQAKEAGARPIKRGKELCGDTPNITVYQHALHNMSWVDGIVAVQANSPTIDRNLIVWAKKCMEMGAQEVMTVHKDRSIYGSIWGITTRKLFTYEDPYDPHPDMFLLDPSVDIHTKEDYEKATYEDGCRY